MPIRLGDLADDNASLHVRCRQCGRSYLLPGKLLVQRYGANTLLIGLLSRMRCERDGMPPDARILLELNDVNHEAMRRGLCVHRPPW